MATTIKESNDQDRHYETEENRVIKIQGEFHEAKRTIFSGEPNPITMEEWLRQIKRTMDNQEVLEDVRGVVACTYLEEQAYHWWESILSIPVT